MYVMNRALIYWLGSSRKTKMEARSVWMAAAGPRSSRKRAAAETPCPFREDTAKPSKKKKGEANLLNILHHYSPETMHFTASSLTTAPHVQDSDGGCRVTVTQAQAPDYQLPLKPSMYIFCSQKFSHMPLSV